MTNKEVYDIVKSIDDKFEKLVLKEDCRERHSLVYKIMFTLFTVNIIGFAGLILTIVFRG